MTPLCPQSGYPASRYPRRSQGLAGIARIPHASVGNHANARRELRLLPTQLLAGDQALTHRLVLLEHACGTPPAPRARTLGDIGLLQHVQHASIYEVMQLIETEQLYGQGCGSVELILLAPALMTPGARLWTLDRRLSARMRTAHIAVYSAHCTFAQRRFDLRGMAYHLRHVLIILKII